MIIKLNYEIFLNFYYFRYNFSLYVKTYLIDFFRLKNFVEFK